MEPHEVESELTAIPAGAKPVQPKHTPGPWGWKEGGVVFGGPMRHYVNGSAQDQIAMVCHMPPGAGDQSANAAIIAAAPDLLAALKDMREGWRYIRQHHGDLYGVGWDRAEKAADAAIAKAQPASGGSKRRAG